MKPATPVTIIINNYNYGRYLSDAIDSALAQSYPWTEVVVVDDGSSDDSRAVIASYGDRIVAILKANGGQASALNMGFERSKGSAVIFLDADDMLHPDIAARVVECFAANPDVVRVQFRLGVMDAEGLATGNTKPPQAMAIPSGDLRQRVLLYGDDIPWLPTSGNAFSATMLRRILPIPEAQYRICADYYLSNLSPLFGLVDSLDEIGGYYRVHGANNHEKGRLDLHQTRQLIVRTRQTHIYLEQTAQQLGLVEAGKMDRAHTGVATLSLTFLANRLISRRLDAAHHPFDGDTPFGLARRGLVAAWQRTDLTWRLRLLYMVWYVVSALAPQHLVRWLAEQFFYPEARGRWLNALLTTRGHARPTTQLQS